MKFPVDIDDIRQAATRISGHVDRTPLLESRFLNDRLRFRLLLKAECLQPTGSFKVRGAFNQVLQLSEEQRQKRIIAFSSGNHGQAVAYAARMAGLKATILMPHNAPRIKVENTRAHGAEIVTYNIVTEDRYVVGNQLVKDRDGMLIHSYDDPRTVAGQGTVGLEIAEQTAKHEIIPDAIIVNCSGGGLAAGIAVTRDLYPAGYLPKIFTAEPKEFDDARRSLKAGEIVANAKTCGSICDALVMPCIASDNFAILRHHGAEGLVASDEDVTAAMAIACEYFGLTLEPSGAVGLACALLNADRFRKQTVVVIASGRNVDPERYLDMVRKGRRNLLASLMPA